MKIKYLMAVGLVMLITIGVVGCSAEADKNGAESQQNPAIENQQKSQEQEKITDGQQTGEAKQGQPITEGNTAGQSEGKNAISVIAKSGNESSNDEKNLILDEITRELDEILSNANALDEVAEADLN